MVSLGLRTQEGADGMVRLWDFETETSSSSSRRRSGSRWSDSPDGTEMLYPHELSVRRMPSTATDCATKASRTGYDSRWMDQRSIRRWMLSL